MKLKIIDKKNEPDQYSGIYENSNGGTEMMYRQLMSRLSDENKNKFQIICSRFRKLQPDKIPIFWLHDLVDDPESMHLQDPTYRKQFSKLVFVSDWQFQSFNQGLGVPYSESVVLKNAIQTIDMSNVEKDKDKINLIYHTTPHRGLEILVPVFIHMAENNPKLHLDVFSSFEAYGWGHRDEPYTNLFETCKNHPQITYHGYQPNDVVKERLKQTHIFAYPCIWKETSCIAAIEAMSANNIVVCPNLGALPETVGNTGYVYHWDENMNLHANRFYEVLRLAINNLPKSSGMVQSAKYRIDQLYNWETRIAEWNMLLDTLRKKSEENSI